MADDHRHTEPSGPTQAAEAAEARMYAAPDQLPTPEEEAAADRADGIDPEVERNYEEAIERGARQKGEGRLP